VASEEQTLPDEEVEADEMYQNAGEKGEKHDDEDDPPRSRSNPRRGRGTYETDRPVVTGTVGRESGILHLAVTTDTTHDTMVPLFDQQIPDDATLYSDEALHFVHVAEPLDEHHQVTHTQDEYARDPDGDGFHEIHSNTIEGIWVGLRNFLRRFRGVHKDYLPDYVAMFEWAYNLDKVSGDFLRLLMKPDFTLLPT
jgi:transposase-like protein